MRGMKKFVAAAALMLLSVSIVHAADKTLGEGEGTFKPAALPALATLPLSDDLTPAERDYLGLKKKGPFVITDIKADVLFLEFLNVYCYACNMQAPIMDEVYKKVNERADMKGKVRFLGVGVGNNMKEIAQFRDRYDIPFPIVADTHFDAWDGIGTPGGTPFMMVIVPLKAAGGAVMAHLGVLRNVDEFLRRIDEALKGKTDTTPPVAYYQFKSGEWRNLKPDLTEAQIQERLKGAAGEAGVKAATVEAVTVGTETFYRVKAGDGKTLWAKIAGRAKICNVCHDIFFIVLFDPAGKIVNLSPIIITKYKNVEFDAKDVAFLKQRVIGRSIADPIVFSPEVDAVSTATMSSELVFDTLRRLTPSFAAMKEKGLLGK